MVVDALRLAALPADQQIAALPDFVALPDEIALTYEDAWLLVPQIRDAGLLTDDQYEALARIDRHHEELANASDRNSLWTIEALENDERWATTRQLADEALSSLGCVPGPPHLRAHTWVPAGD